MRINHEPLLQLTEAFKGLADPTRLRIINLLLHGELCVCHIQRVLGASQPNVSRHLNYLKHSDLVLDRREGFRVYYRVTPHTPGKIGNLCRFLRQALEGDAALRADLKRLKDSKRVGAPAACPPFGRGLQ